MSTVAPKAPAPPQEDSTQLAPQISLRAWLIGLCLIPLLIYWLEYTEIVAKGPDLAAMSLPMAVVFALMLLIPLNLLVRRIVPRLALSQTELLLIYSMNVLAVYIGGIGMIQFLNPLLAGWKYYASSSNNWSSWQYLIRPWAVPNPSVIPAYYAGRSSFFTPVNLLGWTRPILIWSCFLFILLLCFYCIAALFRKQWADNERLTFPIVQIPLEITRDGGNAPLWRNRLFWLGAAFPIFFESIAAIHFTLAPALPYFPIKPQPSLELDSYISSPPWNAMGYTTVSFYPMVIGLTYLLSLDVSFSCWFFYLLTKAENIACAALGFRASGAGAGLAGLPYLNEQSIGAFFALALVSLILGKRHLQQAWRCAFGQSSEISDKNEPLSYRAAFLGLLISGIALVSFGAALGLSWFLSLIFFVLFLLMALAMTRIRAEAGLPWGPGGSAGWPGAHTAIIEFGGTQSLSAQEMTGITFLRWFDSDWRCLAQPAELEAMKMATDSRPRPLNARFLTFALATAALVALPCAWASCLGLYYHYGAASGKIDLWRTSQGFSPFAILQGWLNNPLPPNGYQIGGGMIGAAVVWLLAAMRARFAWWPFNPIGYAAGNSDLMTWIWFPTLIGWMLKSIILRYGGVKLYRQVLPIFLGLFLGDYAISGVWALIFLAFHLPGYRTFPI